MSAARIRIGPWTANRDLNVLEHGERSVKVEPRAMDVLYALAERPGEVLSVNDLIAVVWKGAIVTDGSVYLAINQLRTAFGDDARFIETIPKRGYRLTAPAVVESASKPASDATPASSPEPALAVPPVGRRPAWLAGAVAVAVLIAAGVFTWTWRGERDDARPLTIAVLPFDNLSSDPEQGYLADGIAEELGDALYRVRDLQVTARSSTSRYRDTDKDARAIGGALGVGHLVQGSVQKAGDRVRIAARLVDAKTGRQRWSATYDRNLSDIFAVQQEIARAIADELQVTLGAGDLGPLPGMTRNVAAYDEFLRGRALNLQMEPDTLPLAIQHLRRAVALDPSFSLAWSRLATVYENGALTVPARATEWQRASADALAHAAALTPDSPEVLLARGISESRSGAWIDAGATFAQVEAAYTRYARKERSFGPRGMLFLNVGRVREAIAALESASAFEPMEVAYAQALSHAYLADNNLEAARASADRARELEGLDTTLLETGMTIALTNRDPDEIKLRVAEFSYSDPGIGVHRALSRLLDDPAAASAEIRRIAESSGARERQRLLKWAAYYGDTSLVLELLATLPPALIHPGLLWQPLLRDARKQPAFNKIVRDLGLIEYWRAYGWPDACRATTEEEFSCE